MADTSSFDIVSDYDRQELVNALDQALREIKSRFDLKDTQTTLELGEQSITVNTSSEFTLEAVHSVLTAKAAKRNLSLKMFDYGVVESASGNRVRQVITLKRGISQDIAKQISKLIRDEFKKVQASIQGESVRVSSKSKDDLQLVIQRIKQEDCGFTVFKLSLVFEIKINEGTGQPSNFCTIKQIRPFPLPNNPFHPNSSGKMSSECLWICPM